MIRLIPLLFLLSACDTIVDVENLEPEIVADSLGWCSQGDEAFVTFALIDREADLASVELIYEGKALAVGASGDGAENLITSPLGTAHRVHWARPCTGEGCYQPSCLDTNACVPAPEGAAGELRLRLVETGAEVSASLGAAEPCQP